MTAAPGFADEPPKPAPAAVQAQAASAVAAPAVSTSPASATVTPADAPAPAPKAGTVSFFRDVAPILRATCTGCHRPGKREGKLLLTTYTSLKKGGEDGPGFIPGDPDGSQILHMIASDDPKERPDMPPEGEGDPLKPAEVDRIRRWIAEGATDDTPAAAAGPTKENPPQYFAPPVIASLAYSPDGKFLAVAGYHEVLLHYADGSGIAARLIGESPRVQSLIFSKDGKRLAVSGGNPTEFGEVQLWDMADYSEAKSFKVTHDTLYGVALSGSASRVAFGCADKTVRILATTDGRELIKVDNHSDWVLGATFTHDGKRLVTAGRDRACKLIDTESGQFIDDINKLIEPVFAIARHPTEDMVVYGGSMGGIRIYRMSDNQKRTAGNIDTNLVKDFERFSGPVQAVAFSPDGKFIAAGGVGEEVRVYEVDSGKRVATLGGHAGAVCAVAFHPTENKLCTGGWDGKVRIFDLATAQLAKEFIPVPLRKAGKAGGE